MEKLTPIFFKKKLRQIEFPYIIKLRTIIIKDVVYLSHNYSIKILLNIKDKNIFFDNNFVENKNVKGINSKVFNAKLTYSPNNCPCCGGDGKQIIKYGFKASLINMPKISSFNTYINLKKQRFLCKQCYQTFIATTNIVNKHCHISKYTKLAIALEASEKISEKDIARHFNVSHNTVNRVISSHFNDYSPNKDFLPKVLCFDEFKSTKNCSGAMSFIMCDGITHKIVDIVENRQLNHLIDYFSRYTLESRNMVEHIVIDMYSPYLSLIKELFPKAKVSIDRFHLVQLVNRSFNKTRIAVMNQYSNKNKPLYNKLKKYWKLLLMSYTDLSYERKIYCRSFKRYISQKEIIDYLLDQDEELSMAYDVYQDFHYAIKKRSFELFKIALKKHKNIENKYLKTSLNTFKIYLNHIENSLKYEYSNGPLEGINNKIKVIKRIAFGYRSFLNLRRRILITCNLINIKGTSSV